MAIIFSLVPSARGTRNIATTGDAKAEITRPVQSLASFATSDALPTLYGYKQGAATPTPPSEIPSQNRKYIFGPND